MIVAIPTFKAVKKYFSSAKLILLTKHEPIFNENQPLTSLIGNDVFNEIIYYKSEDLKNLPNIYLLMKRIRKYNIDAIIYLGRTSVPFLRVLRDIFFFYFSGCRKLYGFRLNKHRLFRIAQRYYRIFDREPERLLKILLPLGISQEKVDFSLPISQQDKQFIDNLWPKPEKLKNRSIIAINPWAKFLVNHWPKERFLGLAKKLVNEDKAFIVIVGGNDAQETCNYIGSNLSMEDSLNLCGKTNFMQTAEAISRCNLLISCDSGAVHLAAAVYKPVVGIYTARDYPNCWYPWGNRHIVIRHDVTCQVCFKTKCLIMKCISSISVEEVLSACRKILAPAQF
jgi:ADP-heptose:LPS heptosyltransferase